MSATFYVDGVTEYPLEAIRGAARRVGRKWSHLWTDGTVDELHAFAAKLGMRRSWFQGHHADFPHYDLVPARRAMAIRLGAIEILKWYRNRVQKPSP
jgi:hypothetical protein